MNLQTNIGQRALVTGGSGVLGRHLASALLNQGIAVRILDLSLPPQELQGIEFVQGDLTDADTAMNVCRECSVVFHLAGRMPQALLSEEGFRKVNVDGTRNVAEGCVRHAVPMMVFASTIEIYGPQTAFPISEDAPKYFTGIYSRNKWECEQMLLEYRRRNGLRVAMLRMPMILGPGFYHEKAMMEMMRRVRRGRPLPLPGGRDLPFVAVAASDAADAFLLATARKDADGEAFNIAATRAEPTRELFSKFIQAIGSTSVIIPVPRWILSPLISVGVKLKRPIPFLHTPAELLPFALTGGDYDISKARNILGYDPKKDCLSSLVETYNWLLKQNLL